MMWELLDPFSGKVTDLDLYLEGIHRIFKTDFEELPLPWATNDSFVHHKKLPPVLEWPQGFWHIISTTNTFKDHRDIDFERCRRLHWIRPMILLFNRFYPEQGNGEIHWWKSRPRRNASTRYAIASPDFSYVVIIEERRDYALLITAYPVEYEHRQRKFQLEHQDYWKGR